MWRSGPHDSCTTYYNVACQGKAAYSSRFHSSSYGDPMWTQTMRWSYYHIYIECQYTISYIIYIITWCSEPSLCHLGHNISTSFSMAERPVVLVHWSQAWLMKMPARWGCNRGNMVGARTRVYILHTEIRITNYAMDILLTCLSLTSCTLVLHDVCCQLSIMRRTAVDQDKD